MGRKKYKNKKTPAAVGSFVVGTHDEAPVAEPATSPASLSLGWVVVSLLALLGVTVWSYWPTLTWMESQWRTQADYSHGYLIVPFAIGLLVKRFDLYPGVSREVGWGGLGLLAIALALRVVSRVGYLDFLDGWTLVFWVGGIVWMLFGWRVFYWSLPAVVFLVLMTPLPFRAETLLSNQLQTIATKLSVVTLQSLGLPAIAEGNTIWLDDQQMLVEEACSGLRMFVGMGAIAYVFAVLARRAWVDKWAVIAAAFPIAIGVNVLRVVGTVLAFHWLPSDAAKFLHDLFGIVMVVMGAALLMGFNWYWKQLYRPLDSSLNLRELSLDGING